METAGSVPHSPELSSYPEPNKSNSSYSNIVLTSTPRLSYRSLSCRFTVRMMKALLPYILPACPAHLNLFTLTILGELYKL